MELTCKACGNWKTMDAWELRECLEKVDDVFFGSSYAGGFALGWLPDDSEKPELVVTGSFLEEDAEFEEEASTVTRILLKMRAASCERWTKRALKRVSFQKNVKLRQFKTLRARGGKFVVCSKVNREQNSLASLVDDGSFSVAVLAALTYCKDDPLMKMSLGDLPPAYKHLIIKMKLFKWDDFLVGFKRASAAC